jgi:hypothetical protein
MTRLGPIKRAVVVSLVATAFTSACVTVPPPVVNRPPSGYAQPHPCSTCNTVRGPPGKSEARLRSEMAYCSQYAAYYYRGNVGAYAQCLFRYGDTIRLADGRYYPVAQTPAPLYPQRAPPQYVAPPPLPPPNHAAAPQPVTPVAGQPRPSPNLDAPPEPPPPAANSDTDNTAAVVGGVAIVVGGLLAENAFLEQADKSNDCRQKALAHGLVDTINGGLVEAGIDALLGNDQNTSPEAKARIDAIQLFVAGALDKEGVRGYEKELLISASKSEFPNDPFAVGYLINSVDYYLQCLRGSG